MGNTLQSVSEYFKGSDVPDVHPFQKVPKQNTYNQQNKALNKSGEQPFGYDGNKHIKDNESHKTLKTKK